MKISMKQPYDKVQMVSKYLRAIVDLTRPFTVGVVMLITLFVAVLAVKYSGHGVIEYGRQIVDVIVAVGLAQVFSNVINQVEDLEEDRINKPYRPIPQGIIYEKDALAIGYVSAFIAVFRALFVSRDFTLMVMAIIAGTYVYSVPPFRTKKRYVLNNLTIGIFRGVIGPLAPWVAFVGFDMHVIVPMTLIGAFVFFGITSKDLNDIEGDRKVGNKTFPVVLGRDGAFILMMAGMLISLMIIMTYGWVAHLYGLFYTAIISTFMVLWAVDMYMHGTAESEYVENNYIWAVQYLSLLLMVIGLYVSIVAKVV